MIVPLNSMKEVPLSIKGGPLSVAKRYPSLAGNDSPGDNRFSME